eukprot:8258691-Pyramimonas_sp.AAC.1
MAGEARRTARRPGSACASLGSTPRTARAASVIQRSPSAATSTRAGRRARATSPARATARCAPAAAPTSVRA